MSRKRDREKRLKRMQLHQYHQYHALGLPNPGARYGCAHPVTEYKAAGYRCPDIVAGKPECDEIPF